MNYLPYQSWRGRFQEADVKIAFLSALFGRRPLTWQVDTGIAGSIPPAAELQEFYEASRSAIQQVMATDLELVWQCTACTARCTATAR
jgi:hypothetical protein